MAENSKALEKEIKDILGKAPELRGYTPKELAKEIREAEKNWPTGRWHIEYIRYPRGTNERIGEAYEKLEALVKKSKKSSKTS